MGKNPYSPRKHKAGLSIPLMLIISCLFGSGCGHGDSPKVFHIGILYESSSLSATITGFKDKMSELGYVEGQNVRYDIQFSGDNPAINRKIAEDFVKKDVDLIFAFPLMAALAAKTAVADKSIPVIFTIAGLEGTHLVDSVREPGGNITGVRSPITELPTKSFEIMLELVPRMKRLYIPYAAGYPAVLPGLAALRGVAASAGVALVETPVTSLEELEADLRAREASGDMGMDAILLMTENLVQSEDGLEILNRFTEKHNVPIGALTPWVVHKGAVFVSGLDMREMGELAAPLADKVLKGAKAGAIPVVSPELHLRINYKRARELGLTVPQWLMLQAEEIIQ